MGQRVIRRPRRKAEETREDILLTAERLFRARGYAGVSIADIAAELDMSPANIFKHFNSKLALGRATAYRHARRFADLCSTTDSSLPPDEKLMFFLKRLSREHLHDMTENYYLFEMLPLVFEEPQKEGRIYRRLVEEQVKAFVAEAMEDGIYREGDPARVAATVVDMMAAVLHPRMLECADIATLSDKTKVMIDIIDCGLKYRIAK